MIVIAKNKELITFDKPLPRLFDLSRKKVDLRRNNHVLKWIPREELWFEKICQKYRDKVIYKC